MTLDQCINPLYAYRNRERLLPYLKKRSTGFIRFRRLKQFKNQHAGKRCFIIGNGPSLKMSDLDQLTSELTFAANKIYMAFYRTDWRPSYYVGWGEGLSANCNHKVATGFSPQSVQEFFAASMALKN